MDGPSPWESNNGSATAIAQRGVSGVDLSAFLRGLFGHQGCYRAGDIQFTVNNTALTAWEDVISGSLQLGITGSPTGKVGGGSFGAGPDALHKCVRMTSLNHFNAFAEWLAGLDLSTWTYGGRLLWEIAGAGTARLLGMKHSVIASGPHISMVQATKIVTVHAPGSTDGSVTFTAAINLNEAYTIISRFDGSTHFASIRGGDGVLIEALSAAHEGTTTDGNDFIVHDGATPCRMKQAIHYKEFLSDAEEVEFADNFLTESLPG